MSVMVAPGGWRVEAVRVERWKGSRRTVRDEYRVKQHGLGESRRLVTLRTPEDVAAVMGAAFADLVPEA